MKPTKHICSYWNIFEYFSHRFWKKTKLFHLFIGKEEKLFEKLSDDAKERIIQAISAFTAMNQKLVQGDIKINLLSIILQRRKAFLDLQKIGNNIFWNFSS